MRISFGRALTGLCAVAVLGGACVAQSLRMQTTATPGIAAGQTAWVHFYWQNGTSDVLSSFEATATLPSGYAVAYPAGRGFSSLNQNDDLQPGEVDYHAIQITVPVSENRSRRATTTVRYVRNGQTVVDNYTFTISLARYNGQDMKVVTTDLDPMTTDSASWIHVYFQGMAPRLDNFKVTVKDSQGLSVVYPGGRTYSGLYSDSTLSAGEVDYSGFYVDTTGMQSGSYQLELLISYDKKKSETQTAFVGFVVGDGSPQPPTQPDTLTCDVQRMTRSQLTATFYLDAGATWKGSTYQVVGSLSGTLPGLELNGQRLPLNLDPYLLFTASKPNQGLLAKASGKLDKQGRAYSTFSMPAALLPFLNGITVYHAFVLLDNKATVLFTSNWVPLTFLDQ